MSFHTHTHTRIRIPSHQLHPPFTCLFCLCDVFCPSFDIYLPFICSTWIQPLLQITCRVIWCLADPFRFAVPVVAGLHSTHVPDGSLAAVVSHSSISISFSARGFLPIALSGYLFPVRNPATTSLIDSLIIYPIHPPPPPPGLDSPSAP